MKRVAIIILIVMGILLTGCGVVTEPLPAGEPTLTNTVTIQTTPRLGEIFYKDKRINKALYQYDREVSITPMYLVDNSAATNVTLSEVMEFLARTRVKRDALCGDLNSRFFAGEIYETCGYYTEEAHNDAEAQGIRAGVVVLEGEGRDYHGINVFDTTDNGLIFVDCSYYSDRVVTPTIGQSYEVYGDFFTLKEVTIIWDGYSK